jgi:hypothetical protein
MAFPFPVMAPIFSTVLFGSHFWKFSIWYVPKLAICHYWYCAWLICTHFWYWAMPFLVRTFTGPRTGTRLYIRVIPFPVPGSASSGMVVFRVPYQNWTLLHYTYSWQKKGGYLRRRHRHTIVQKMTNFNLWFGKFCLSTWNCICAT